MPEICCFHGIIIRMRFREHPPPHFHVEYGGFNASVSIADLALSEGRLPGRVERLVLTWAARYQEDLLANWARTQNHETPIRIDPLP
jgi:hypothetical protein